MDGHGQYALIECCEKELVGRAAKLVARGGCHWAGLGDRPLWLSPYSFAKIRNRERGGKFAEQQEGGEPGAVM